MIKTGVIMWIGNQRQTKMQLIQHDGNGSVMRYYHNHDCEAVVTKEMMRVTTLTLQPPSLPPSHPHHHKEP